MIIVGCGIFVLALGVSAVFVPEIRWLHVFQALMYVAAAGLSIRGSRWGYFIGISAAGLWSWLGVFGSPLFFEFLRQPARPDLILQVIAWVANVVVVIGCVWAYVRRAPHRRTDLARAILAAGVTTGYLAAAIALFAPARLSIFRALLRPHWPWLGA